MVLRTKQILAFAFALVSANLLAQDLDVSIRLYNERIYFPGTPIQVLVTVFNDSPEPVSFDLAHNRAFNVSFDVRDETNTPVSSTPEFTTARQPNQQIFYRSLNLQPGEQFSFYEELNRYVEIREPGQYIVQARFFPRLQNGTPARAQSSNAMNITIRPGQTEAIQEDMRFAAIAETHLQQERQAPDDVIRSMLRARQQDNWDRFFLYINLEKLYRQTPANDRRFIRLSQQSQLEELQQYRAELEQMPSDAGLVAIPDSFEILRTEYIRENSLGLQPGGTVTARLGFQRDGYRERREYTYRLEPRDGFWEVVGYEVANLPNEAGE